MRQRGPGACGTVDCCHEREGQTHLWEAPPGGTHHPVDPGVRRPELTTERAHPSPAQARLVFARTVSVDYTRGFTGQPPSQAAAGLSSSRARAGLPVLPLAREGRRLVRAPQCCGRSSRTDESRLDDLRRLRKRRNITPHRTCAVAAPSTSLHILVRSETWVGPPSPGTSTRLGLEPVVLRPRPDEKISPLVRHPR